MWLGSYHWINLFGIFLQSTFIQNILLANFLGMCSYLACSDNVATANGLGLSVAVVLTFTGSLNWFVHNFITAPGALSWLSELSPIFSELNLDFLELILFIATIAAFVQILEMIIEKFSQTLYQSLGIFLPLIAVNCAILGGVLFGTIRNYPFIPMTIFCLGAGAGWWFAIVIFAVIKEKLAYSNPPCGLKGMGLSLITTGLIAMAFMGLTGIDLTRNATVNTDTEKISEFQIEENQKEQSNDISL
ncbi:MAG: NADH:ubiquinone reductase (Na(+)-transporting) subunit E [Victivallaceae bacterium]